MHQTCTCGLALSFLQWKESCIHKALIPPLSQYVFCACRSISVHLLQPQPREWAPEAPAFSLPSQERTQVSLRSIQGQVGSTIFYPKDFTSGCTIEAHNFQRDIDKYTQKNAVVVGVSVDDVDSHKSFCTKEGLNFKLLRIPAVRSCKNNGSIMEYKKRRDSCTRRCIP